MKNVHVKQHADEWGVTMRDEIDVIFGESFNVVVAALIVVVIYFMLCMMKSVIKSSNKKESCGTTKKKIMSSIRRRCWIYITLSRPLGLWSLHCLHRGTTSRRIHDVLLDDIARSRDGSKTSIYCNWDQGVESFWWIQRGHQSIRLMSLYSWNQVFFGEHLLTFMLGGWKKTISCCNVTSKMSCYIYNIPETSKTIQYNVYNGILIYISWIWLQNTIQRCKKFDKYKLYPILPLNASTHVHVYPFCESY